MCYVVFSFHLTLCSLSVFMFVCSLLSICISHSLSNLPDILLIKKSLLLILFFSLTIYRCFIGIVSVFLYYLDLRCRFYALIYCYTWHQSTFLRSSFVVFVIIKFPAVRRTQTVPIGPNFFSPPYPFLMMIHGKQQQSCRTAKNANWIPM